ncbi:MAG: phosphopantetheinyl transferase [Massilia sp.]|nr:phosphopantetheinyl transferase [Massilia sp.]
MSGGAGARLMVRAVPVWKAWPGSPAAPAAQPRWEGALLVMCISHPAGATRAVARTRIRAALCAALAQSLGLDPGQVTLAAAPGTAPRVLIDGAPCAIGVSLSHAGKLSIAALNQDGAVGVDLMDVAALPHDWHQVACDYLGISVADQLATVAPIARSLAFAQAWAEREAHLKLLGLPLAEWTPLPGACRWQALALPPGFAGALATGR